jgi:hypothetical protein
MWSCDIRFTLDGDVDYNVTHLTEQRNRAQDRKQGMFDGDLTCPSKTLASLEIGDTTKSLTLSRVLSHVTFLTSGASRISDCLLSEDVNVDESVGPS